MLSAFQHFSLSAFVLVLFAACSPSLDEAKQVLQQRVTSQSQGHIKLVSFRKTALQEFQVKGVRGRRISYAAEVEFAHRGIWSGWMGEGSVRFDYSPTDRSEQGTTSEIIGDLWGKRQMYEGDRIKIAGVMAGTNTASGWRYGLEEIRLAGN